VASMAVEETGSSGIDNGGGDRRSQEQWSRERRGLSFGMKSQMTHSGILLIGSKISAVVLN
jgi:hypothetical protein